MASADYTVLTPERVSLEYGIAGIGSRAAAVIIDTLIQGISFSLIGLGLFAALVAVGTLGSLGNVGTFGNATTVAIVFGLLALAGFIITSGYFMFFEIVWNGQTPGKRAVGLRVIRESGYPIRPIDAVIRNLVRMVDWLPLGYGVGVLVMLTNRRSKRVGDFASGTLVVREGTRRTLSHVLASTPPTPIGVALSSADATLIRDFLLRRAAMDPKARAAFATRLAGVLAQRYHLSLESASDTEGFLEQIVS